MQAERPHANHKKKMCGAKTRDGDPCRNTTIMSNGRCRMHGGVSVKGIAHPSFKTGRYSKDMPTKLAARYQVALADPDLLQLADEIRLTDSLVTAFLDGFDPADSKQRAELMGLIEQRRRLVESEGKRLSAMQQMITVERALALIGHVTEAVLRHVDDPVTRKAIAREIRAIVD